MTYERTHIERMRGYQPGAQPDQLAIKLNTNENPLPPSPHVLNCLAGIAGKTLQRYPDPLANEFRASVARHHGLGAEQVIATNGGDELLRLALTTFVEPGRPIGVAVPSYGLYSVLAAIHQSPISGVALTDAWRLPADATDRWNSEGAQLAILTNPHAPSGTLEPIDAIERVAAKFRGVILIDEAYVDFISSELMHDATKLIKEYSNILILRSFSKGYSLAGLRLGYGIGNIRLISPMIQKTKDSYNVDAIAQKLGAAALDDAEYARKSWQYVREQRMLLTSSLSKLGFDVIPSEANFLLTLVPRNAGWHDARDLHAKLEKRQIYVRWFDEDRLRNRLRISIGTSAENQTLVSALEQLRGSDQLLQSS